MPIIPKNTEKLQNDNNMHLNMWIAQVQCRGHLHQEGVLPQCEMALECYTDGVEIADISDLDRQKFKRA